MVEKLKLCGECSAIIHAKDRMYRHEGKIYCFWCGLRVLPVCKDCHELQSSKDDLKRTSDNVKLCKTCMANKTAVCYHCDSVVWNGNSCEPFNGNVYCSDCYHENFIRCYHCDVEMYQEDALYHHDSYYCCECYDEYCEEDSYGIFPYDYTPSPIFLGGSDPDDYFFGIELEVEYNKCRDIKGVISSMPDFVYLKSDGSLKHGMEIVSHPMSWKWYNEHKKDWLNILDIRKEGMSSYFSGTCGIHIHIDRRAFSTLCLYRFMKIFMKYGDKILQISQRSSSNLSQWATLEDSDGTTMAYKAKHKSGKNKYSAINLAHQHTVEVRIFRGTLFPLSFFKNIEFTRALWEYSKQRILICDVTWDNFMAFVRKNKAKHANLNEFITQKGI